jgi:Helix-turn-helix domain
MGNSRKRKGRNGLLDTVQAAAFLGLCPNQLEQWRSRRARGGPPFLRVAKHAIRYSRLDLEQWLRARRVEAEAK